MTRKLNQYASDLRLGAVGWAAIIVLIATGTAVLYCLSREFVDQRNLESQVASLAQTPWLNEVRNLKSNSKDAVDSSYAKAVESAARFQFYYPSAFVKQPATSLSGNWSQLTDLQRQNLQEYLEMFEPIRQELLDSERDAKRTRLAVSYPYSPLDGRCFDLLRCHGLQSIAMNNKRMVLDDIELIARRWQFQKLHEGFQLVQLMHYTMELAANSLQISDWNESELEVLRGYVDKPIDVSSLVREELAFRCLYLTEQLQKFQMASKFENPWLRTEDMVLNQIMASPGGLLKVIAYYRDLLTVIDQQGLSQLHEFDHAVGDTDNEVASVYLPPRPLDLVRVYQVTEKYRRLAALALAIKHFRLTENRWPNSIGEVSDAGWIDSQQFKPFQVKGLDICHFAFRASDDTAYVWAWTLPLPSQDDNQLLRTDYFNLSLGEIENIKTEPRDFRGNKLTIVEIRK